MKPVARNRPCFTIFGGPNGSGKSTAYDRFVRAGFDSGEYLNPDEIAKSASESGAGRSAFDMRAGRVVLERTRSLIDARRSFVRESTLTGREIVRTAVRARAAGYRLVLVFVAVSSPATPRGRIAVRVAKGGHDIPLEAQERRFPPLARQRTEDGALCRCGLLPGQRRAPAPAGRDGVWGNAHLLGRAGGGVGRASHGGSAEGSPAEVARGSARGPAFG